MKSILSVLICFVTTLLFAQNSKYSYTYKLKLSGSPSFYYCTMDTSGPFSTDTTYSIRIKTIDENLNEIPFVNFEIIQDGEDTLKSFTDGNGVSVIKVKMTNFRLNITSSYLSSLNEYIALKSFTKRANITVIIGKSFKMAIPELLSKRPLTDEEVIEIIKDASDAMKKNLKIKSRLLDDKTCLLFFEI